MTWNCEFFTLFVAGRRQWAAAVAAAGVLGVAACASVPGGGALTRETPAEARQQAVSKRALERWDALLKGDTKTAYGFLSPASREVTSLERFQARTNPGSFRDIKSDTTTCDAETCKVRLWLTFDHRTMKGVTVPLEETWVIADGRAWLVYRE